MSQKIVTLRVVKGKVPSYDKNGKMLNENQPVKLEHGTLSWKNYMDNLHRNGFCQVTVEKVFELDGKRDKKGQSTGKEVDMEEINEEVQVIMKPIVTKAMTQTEEIAKLKADMLALQKGNPKMPDAPVNETPTDTIPTADDSGMNIKALRAEYKKLNPKGKGAFSGWKADVLKEKIAAFKA